MIKFFVTVLFFLILSIELNAQIIKGEIRSEDSEKLSFTNILIKNAETPELISEFTTSDRNGHFQIELKSDFENLIIEFTRFGYETQIFSFKKSELDKDLLLDVVMKKSSIELEELVIREKPKIEIKEDTVSYKASAFLDGSERKVEDLLKKLPGIEVDDSGKIKYKGKSIEKVLLDGDDLFDYNYVPS